MALIQQARIAAGHDGSAELILLIKYDNAGTTEICLTEDAASRLFEKCQVDQIGDLPGKSWLLVKEALVESSNRFLT